MTDLIFASARDEMQARIDTLRNDARRLAKQSRDLAARSQDFLAESKRTEAMAFEYEAILGDGHRAEVLHEAFVTLDALDREQQREPCSTCEGTNRETTGMVCQTCGWDYMQGEKPA